MSTRNQLASRFRRTLVFGNQFFTYLSSRAEIVVSSGVQELAPLIQLGHYDLGMECVVQVAKAFKIQGDEVVVCGITVVGLLANGKSRIAFSPYSEEQDLRTLEFSPMIPDGDVGEIWMSAGSLGANLYVFEGVRGDITEYVDFDENGVADAPSAIAPCNMSSMSFPGPVCGFHFNVRKHPSLHTNSPSNLESWEIRNPATGLELKSNRAEMIDAMRPTLRNGRARAGQKRLRVFYRPGKTVQVFLGRGAARRPISSAGSPTGPLVDYVDVVLSEDIAVGNVLTFEDVADRTRISQESIVEVARHVVFFGDRGTYSEGASIELHGDNFSKQDTSVRARFDEGGAIANFSWEVVSPNLIVSEAPKLQGGIVDCDKLVLMIADKRFADLDIQKWFLVTKRQ